MQTAACAAAADLVLGLHAATLVFVFLGLALLAQGALLGWSWVRRPAWRWAHLAAIGGVCALQAAGLACPLTAAEDALRACAGQPGYRAGFVSDWTGQPPAAVARAEAVLLVLTLAGFLGLPPRRLRTAA